MMFFMRCIKGHIITTLPLFLFLILISGYISIANVPLAVMSSDATSSTDTITIRNQKSRPLPGGPTLNDPSLKAEQIFTGLDHPTSMAFVGPNDILVTEKNTGLVKRITNGQMNPQPILDVNVANLAERGLLGIAVAKHEDGLTYVFLYYTESGGGKDGDDTSSAVEPLGNRVYRYDFANNKLINPKLLLDLPAKPPPTRPDAERAHNGGKLVIGPDQNVYVGIGDVIGHKGQAQNFPSGAPLDGTGGILRVTQDGEIPANPPLGSTEPLSPYYYAYGIRNIFGIDFDPITGKLWDTENGPKFGDEINLVEPGFNSGWTKIQGLAKDQLTGKAANPATDLVNFGGKGVYRDPEFVWNLPIAPTALKFLNSDKLGKQYQNDMFVGDVNLGWLYNFKLNPERTGLLFDNGSPLADRVANTPDEMRETVLGKGFGVITDIKVGPDGNLYVLAYAGSIYRISSSTS